MRTSLKTLFILLILITIAFVAGVGYCIYLGLYEMAGWSSIYSLVTAFFAIMCVKIGSSVYKNGF